MTTTINDLRLELVLELKTRFECDLRPANEIICGIAARIAGALDTDSVLALLAAEPDLMSRMTRGPHRSLSGTMRSVINDAIIEGHEGLLGDLDFSRVDGTIARTIISFRDLVAAASEKCPDLLPGVKPKHYRWVAYMEELGVDEDIVHDICDLFDHTVPMQMAPDGSQCFARLGMTRAEFYDVHVEAMLSLVHLAQSYPSRFILELRSELSRNLPLVLA